MSKNEKKKEKPETHKGKKRFFTACLISSEDIEKKKKDKPKNKD